MKTVLRMIWACGLAAVVECAANQVAGAATNDGAETRASSPELNRLFEDYWEEHLQLNPLAATLSGDHRYDDRLGISITEAHRAQTRELCEKYLRQLKRFEGAPLSPRDRLNRDVLVYDLDLNLRELAFDAHLL